MVDRALVTVGLPKQLLVEVDLRQNEDRIDADLETWKVDAFRATQTGAITFLNSRLSPNAPVGASGWYLERPGFWHGACGPAACWAGGVAGLLDFALESKRDDPHTLAHLGAMQAGIWGMYSLLRQAGDEIDGAPCDGNGWANSRLAAPSFDRANGCRNTPTVFPGLRSLPIVDGRENGTSIPGGGSLYAPVPC